MYPHYQIGLEAQYTNLGPSPHNGHSTSINASFFATMHLNFEATLFLGQCLATLLEMKFDKSTIGLRLLIFFIPTKFQEN